MPTAEPRFPADFDPEAWDEDFARSTGAGRAAGEAARRDCEQDGVPQSLLQPCDAEGRDGTALPQCVLCEHQHKTQLYITAEWDDDQAETAVCVSGADLTPPYALLLVEGLFEQAEAEAQTLRAGSPTRNRARSAEALSSGPVSIYEQMAGRPGRPANHEAALNGLLEHLMEPAGRQARRRAAEAIHQAAR